MDGDSLGAVRRDSRRGIGVTRPDRTDDVELTKPLGISTGYPAFGLVPRACACTGEDLKALPQPHSTSSISPVTSRGSTARRCPF
jgi:hypothetical protein